jgi:plastocyanin
MKTLFWIKTLTLLMALPFVNAVNAVTVSVQVVDKNGKPLPDAVIVLLPTNKTVKPKIPLSNQPVVAQEKMQFVPAVSIVPLGAKVTFVNNDSWNHHVRAYAANLSKVEAGKENGFSMMLEGKSSGKKAISKEVLMDKPGVFGATLLGCFIHGSMSGHIYVTESPWAAKTNAEGWANFEDAPEGISHFRVWQMDQPVDLPLQQIDVTAAGAKQVVKLVHVTARRVRAAPAAASSSGYAY